LILFKAILKGIFVSLIFAGLYFGLDYFARYSGKTPWIDFVNWSTLITLPLFYGFMIAHITPNPERRIVRLITWPPIFAAGLLVFSLISGIEGLICVWMLAAPFCGASMLGGLIYYIYQSWHADIEANKLRICFIIPFVAIYAESQLPLLNNTHLVQSTIQISAPVDVVFQSLKSIPNIDPSEVETNLTHHLNIPKPTSATWHETHRVSQWGPDVRFVERITSVGENDHINWDFEFPVGWIKDGIEDHHIRIGGRFFSVDKGGYELRKLGDVTELTLWTQTTDHTRLGAYAAYWNNFFIGNFHDAILGVVKNRNEPPL
jgi:hypothetical protein